MIETLDPLSSAATVFVMQRPKAKEGGWEPDLSPAMQYGKLEYVFDADDKPHASPTSALAKAKSRLANFDASRDYLLWPNFADISSMLIIVALLTRGGNTRLRYLTWKRTRASEAGFYFPIEINVGL